MTWHGSPAQPGVNTKPPPTKVCLLIAGTAAQARHYIAHLGLAPEAVRIVTSFDQILGVDPAHTWAITCGTHYAHRDAAEIHRMLEVYGIPILEVIN